MARQSKGRMLKRKVYIFTEGETEKNYFSLLNRKYNATMQVQIHLKSTGVQGMGLLQEAESTIHNLPKVERSNIGAVYIISDKDDMTTTEIERVIKKAQKSNITIGYSNSCFEVWLVAHFEKLTTSHTKERLYHIMERRLNCSQYARKHKDDLALLQPLTDLVSVALENTKSMGTFNQTKINTEPYTNIGSIIQMIYARDIY